MTEWLVSTVSEQYLRGWCVQERERVALLRRVVSDHEGEG